MIVLGLTVAAGLAGCGGRAATVTTTLAAPLPQTTGPRPNHLAAIRAAGRVRIGVKFDVPLFGLRDPRSGVLSGFDIEIAKAIAKRLFPAATDPTSHIEFVEAISKNRESYLQQGKTGRTRCTRALRRR